MASRSSRASGGSTSGANSHSAMITRRSAMSRTTRSVRPSSWLGWATASLTALPSSVISDCSTPEDFVARWISFTRGSPASRTPSPASAGATTTREGGPSSSTPCASSASADPPWSSSRTSQPGLPGAGFDDAARRYRDWVTESRTRSSAARRTSARRTGGSESSCWPTVDQFSDTMANRKANAAKRFNAPYTILGIWTTPQAHDAMGGSPERVRRHGTKHGDANLADDVTLWATPRAAADKMGLPRDQAQGDLQAQAMLWPTPNATDGKGANSRNPGKERQPSDDDLPTRVSRLGLQAPRSGLGGPPSSPGGPSSPPRWTSPRAGSNRTSRRAMTSRTDGKGGVAKPSLEQQAVAEIEISRTKKRLNPLFVEWLMGVPLGFTDCAPSGTPASPPRRPTPS